MDEHDRPLEGLRVVELATWIAGPVAARILKYMGADVVKVEPPEGDGLRGMANPARMPGVNPPFDVANFGKRSVALNLKAPEGLAFLGELIANADVFITNLQAPALERYGIDYATLHDRYPALVYCLVTGYGSEDELRERPAFDGAAFWAASGWASLFSRGYEDPVQPRGALGDHQTAMAAAAGICGALVGRARTGKGGKVETSLRQAGAYALTWDLSNHAWVGLAAPNPVRKAATNPINNYYRSRDEKWFTLLGMRSERDWPLVLRAMNLQHLADDDRFTSTRSRAVNGAALVAILDEAFARHDLADIAARLDSESLIWSPMNGPEELMSESYEGKIFDRLQLGDDVRPIIRLPFWFPGLDHEEDGAVPEHGQHTEAILLELGHSWEEIIAAKANGAIP